MTMAKIAISLPRETLRKARGVVRKRRTTLSAYIAELLDERVQDEGFQRLLDEMLTETGGPLTDVEIREADEMLGVRPQKRKR
jgi:hypothetical protein